MRGEHLIQINIQNKIINQLISEGAFSKQTASSLHNVRKGVNFRFLIRKGVIVEYNEKYYLNRSQLAVLEKSKVMRGFPFI